MSEAAQPTQAAVTETEQIDWQALWDEFGFDTPDVDDSIVISPTQLELALEASEQDIEGGYSQYIEAAASDGVLVQRTTSKAFAPGDTTQGYIWEGMLE